MFQNKKININVMLNGLLTVLMYIFPLIVTMYISRTLSPGIIGDISF